MPELIKLPDGWTLVIHESLDSTNAEAVRRIEAGGGASEAILAHLQTEGRASRGRRWESERGNLHLSVTIDPPPRRPPGELAFVAGLAAAEAIELVSQGRVEIALKWPNDLMLGGRKLGGLLIEGAPAAKARTLAVGLGVNLAFRPSAGTFSLPIVCLADVGCHARPEEVAVAFCAGLERWLEVWRDQGFAPIRAAWLGRAAGVGKSLTATLPDGTRWDGVFEDIDRQGALVLRSTDGKRRRIAAGAVFFTAA